MGKEDKIDGGEAVPTQPKKPVSALVGVVGIHVRIWWNYSDCGQKFGLQNMASSGGGESYFPGHIRDLMLFWSSEAWTWDH